MTSPISSTAQVVWHLIKDGFTTPQMIRTFWGRSEWTVRDAIRELVRSELIIRVGHGEYRVVEAVDSPRLAGGASVIPKGGLSTGTRGESTGGVGIHREAGVKRRLESSAEYRLKGGYPPFEGDRGVSAQRGDFEVTTFEEGFSREILLEAKKRGVHEKTSKTVKPLKVG